MIPAHRYKAVLFALALAVMCLSAVPAAAQDTTQQVPPITVKGFDHRFLPDGRVHMNTCRHAGCGPGSKVSYVLFAPQREPDFEQFKRAQVNTLARLKARLPSGSTVVMGTPKRSQDASGTVFRSEREMTVGGADTVFTVSTLIYTETMTVTMTVLYRNHDGLADQFL